MEEIKDEMGGLKENRVELLRLLAKESDPNRKKRIEQFLIDIDARIAVLEGDDANR
jgi:hypothetical protein